ncbi:MAG: hypothetical protein NPIRA02_04540 [Nitrospirales bacterium]|nr:MAG: hypothetical protein NPIRA02_04540 [Nitrospirales bacterium]
MMRSVIGWTAVLLALLALAPSIVPGAMSIFGLLLSLAALILSVGSVRHHSLVYVHATLILVVVGIMVINSGLRIGDPLPMPLHLKLALYGLAGVVLAGSLYAAKTIDASNRRDKSKTSSTSPPS